MDKTQPALETLKKQVETLKIKETQHQKTELALERSQKMLERTEEITGVGSWEWEIATDTVTWSKGLYRIFQLDPTEPPPNWIEHPEHCHPDDRDMLIKAVKAAVTKGIPYEIEIRAFRQDGVLRTCTTQGFVERGPDGRAERLFGFIQDITQKKKAEELQKLQSLVLDQIEDRVAVTDLDGYITYVNDIHTRTLGKTKEEMLGQHISVFGEDPENGATQEEIHRETLRNGTWHGEVVNFRPDQTPMFFDCRTQIIHNDNDHPIALCGIATEITERKQAEAEIKLFKTIAEKSVHGNAIIDTRGNLIFINENFAGVHGYTPAELIGKNLSIFHNDKQMPSAHQAVESLLRDGYYSPTEIWHTKKDGTEFPMLMSGIVITDSKGNPQYLAATAIDITPRHQAREEARKMLRFLEFAIEQIPIPIIIAMAPDVTISHFNQAALDLMIKKTDNIHDVPLAEFCEFCPTFYPDGTPYSVEDLPLVRAIQQGEETCNTEAIVRLKNEDRWILVNAAPLKDKEGHILAGIVAFPDITDRKKAEAEKFRLEEQFHQAQKLESVSRLAGGAAHDLNNLLSPILGFSEMMLNDTDPDDPHRELLGDVLKAGRRARDLVGQLLAFSRRQPLEFQPINVNDLLTGFEKLLRSTIRENIAIHMELATSLPFIKGDDGHVEQVIMNLVINSQDAMPDGGDLTINTALVELIESPDGLSDEIVPGTYVVLTIKDTGTGMDENTRERLFEPFFTTKGVNQGTGLGLATVYGIVKQHGGHILVDSEPGQGTTFNVYLPVTTEPVSLVTRHTESETAASVVNGSETILIVEDNAPMRKMAEIMLKRQGYKVLTAKNGREALLILGNNHGTIDLLLTDVIMPGMNGVELYHQAIQKQPNLKAVFMSGYTDDVIATHDVFNGDVPFLQKPFTINSLADKIRQVFEI